MNKYKVLIFDLDNALIDNLENVRPNKEFFEGIEKILNNYNVDEYLMIGDSLKSDVGFAMKCNFDSCWFNRNNEILNNDYNLTIIIN